MIRVAGPCTFWTRFRVVLALILVVGAQFIVAPGVEAQQFSYQSVSELCGNVPVADERPFTDVVAGMYGGDYVACLKHLGLVNGKGDGSFGLRDELTRGQMASFLARFWRLMSNDECPSSDAPFVDVDVDNVHYDDIICIYNLGITKGRTDTLFDPDPSVTVSELSLFLWRMFTILSERPRNREDLESTVPDVFERAAVNLALYKLIPIVDDWFPGPTEGLGRYPAIRAQVAVYIVNMWFVLELGVSRGTYSMGEWDSFFPWEHSLNPALSHNIDTHFQDTSMAWSPDGTMIAFGEGYQGRDGLYVANVYSGKRRQLFDEGESPSWSPDGSKLVFKSGFSNLYAKNLYVIGADGENLYELAGQPDGAEVSYIYHSPVWSPDGTKIAFVRRIYNKDIGLYVVDVDGGNLSEIWYEISYSQFIFPFQLTWSRDSKRIFFTREEDWEPTSLWVGDTDGKDPVKLTGGGVKESGTDEVTWRSIFYPSPDERSVAFATSHGIYMMDMDGSNRRRIVDWGSTRVDRGSAVGSTMSWSPNGESIVVSLVHGQDYSATGRFYLQNRYQDLFIMRPDGTDVQQLTVTYDDERGPVWSPAGDLIAYLSGGYGRPTDLFVEDASAAFPFRPTTSYVPQARPLTSNDVEDSAPAWSPDGSRIAFVRSEGDDDDTEIYVMAADGSNEVKLTNNNFDDHDPVWSPDSERIFFTRTLSYPYARLLHKDGRPYHVLHVMMADGSEERRIPLGGRDDLKVRSWSLSPDGHQIAFSAYTDAWQKTYVIKTDGSSGIRSLISHGEDYPVYTHYENPVWSPDSKRIALHISGLDRSRSHDIYVVNLDGSNPQPIASTGTERSVDRPLNVAWSSSDRIAVYYQFFDWLRYAPILDDYATYTLKSDGSDLQQVRHIFGGRPREHVSLVWSPDGSRIAFIERGVFDSFANVLVANPDGTGLQQLTHVLGEVSDITWSPDGKHMLFVSSRSTWHELQDDKEIYIIDVP